MMQCPECKGERIAVGGTRIWGEPLRSRMCGTCNGTGEIAEPNLYKEFFELLANVDYIQLIIDMLHDDATDAHLDDTLTPEQKQASWDVYNQVQALVSAINETVQE